MDRQIENLKREISFLEQQLVNLEIEKNKFENELSIGRNNLLVLEREAREVKGEWEEKKRLKDNEKDVDRTKELARECSTLGTVYSARDIRVGEERKQIIIIQNKIREIEAKINNLIRSISNKKSELLSLENEFRNQSSTSKFSFR